MAGRELEQSFFTPKDQRRVGRLREEVLQREGICYVNIGAVAHDWEPGEELFSAVDQANIITLELTRNVVKAGLSESPSSILGRNVFWRRIIERASQSTDERMIRGIEVNQTARIAWKRFSLHFGRSQLAPGIMTIEVQNPEDDILKE